MPSLAVSVDRGSMSLAALTIGQHPSAGFWVPADGLERVAKQWSRTTVSSPFVHGSVETRSRLEQTDTGLRSVYVGAASSAALEARIDELEAALFQFTYPLTVSIDGQARTYQCDRADVSWGSVVAGEVQAFMARATLTIPCAPANAGATSALYVVAPTVPLP